MCWYVDQAIDECDRDTCLNSMKRYQKFSWSCRTWLLFIQQSRNFVPQMFNRVQIWPVHNIDLILLQEVYCCPGCMRTRIIPLERLVLMTCEMRHSMRSQNLIDVTGSCYSITFPRAKILEHNWTKCHVESDATPYHDDWPTLNIPFHHAAVIISFFLPSPQSCSAICGWDAVTAFVREDDVTPLLVTLILSLQCPLKMLLSVSA